MAGKPTFVLVHGACHGSYYWEPLISRLHEAGYASITVDLASTGDDARALGDAYADAAIVRAAVDRCESAIVVSHSYGGVPVTHGLARARNVRHLVYVSAFMLAEGEALDHLSFDNDDAWVVSDDRSTVLVRDAERLFYGHCDPLDAAKSAARLRPHAVRSFSQPVLRAAWRRIPSTYIVCDDDMTIPPHVQLSMAKRADATRVVASDHTPFLSDPDTTAEMMVQVAALA